MFTFRTSFLLHQDKDRVDHQLILSLIVDCIDCIEVCEFKPNSLLRSVAMLTLNLSFFLASRLNELIPGQSFLFNFTHSPVTRYQKI